MNICSPIMFAKWMIPIVRQRIAYIARVVAAISAPEQGRALKKNKKKDD